jgi:OFA family oxalate/formate antiporter-like MFS transporter
MPFVTYRLFCGVGTGIVSVGVVSQMARWFPDRRGLAIGIVAAGYGMGAGPILAAAKRKPPTLSP